MRRMLRQLALLGAVGLAGAALGARERAHERRAPLGAHEAALDAIRLDSARLLSKIHSVNRFEIVIGELTRERARDAGVRRYGDRLARDHRASDRMLIELARAKEIPIEAPPPDPEDRRLLDELRGLSGSAYDKAYLSGMERGHHKTIWLLRSQRAHIQDVEVRRLVNKLLPILEQHHVLAARLRRADEDRG